MAVEQLTIEINYKDGDAGRKIDSLTQSVEALNRATSGKGFKSLGYVTQSMANLANAAQGLSGISQKFNDVATASTKLFNTFKSFDPKAYAGNIKSLTDSLNSIANAVGNFTQKGAGLQNVVNSLKQLPSAASKSGNGSNLSGMKSAADVASMAFSGLGSKMKTVAKLGWELGKMPFKMILSPIQAIGRGIEGMTDRFKSFLVRIGRIALYRAIRAGIKLVTSAVKEGVNNLYTWSTLVGNSFQKTMDSIATSLNYAKNSIGAMFSPILDAIAPVLDAMVDKMVSVINVVNQLIATLTGATTWRRAEKVATSYGNATDGLGNSADKTNNKYKELKRTLLGFDEINKLNDESSSSSNPSSGGSSGGSNLAGGALAFTEQPISSAIQNWADKLKEAWAKGDFTDIGNAIGLKIGTALLNVPWETKIQPAVVKLATSFGTLLNGMFDYNGEGGKAMWDGIAYTIYNAINTAVLGYVTFFKTVNWKGIGQGVGAALRQVLKNINWEWVAEALAAFPNAMIDAVTGFCKEMTAKDFYEAGQNIGRTLSKALIMINWKGLFGNAVTLATNVLNGINGALESFDWVGVKDAILNGIKSVPKERWATLGIQIGRAIFNVANFVANLVDTLISFIREGKWGELVRGIKEGISEGIKSKGGWKGVAKNISDFIGKNLGTISVLLAIGIGISALKNLAGALLTGKLFASMITSAPLAGAAGGTLATLGTIPGFLAACAIAVPVGVTITPIIMEKVDDLVQKFVDTMDPIITPTVEKVFDVITNKNYKPNHIYTGGATAGEKGAPSSTTYKRDLGNGASVWQTASGDLNLPNIDIQKALETARKRAQKAIAGIVTEESERLGAADTTSSQFKLTPVIDVSKLPKEWQTLAKAWQNLASTNKVAKFITEGLRNDGLTWWERLKQYWGTQTNSKKVAKFQTEGVTDQGSTWWGQLAGFWNSIVGRNQASRFSIQGVVNAANEWWSQTQGFWNQATRNSSLTASVGIGNAYNAFASAYNSMQSYFNSHTLTAFVQVSQVGTTVGGSITGALTTSSGSKVSTTNGALNLGDDAINALKKKKKASGGVFKNGFWHDITAFAAGGFPSGQMFIAREAGPELVGTIGGNTAVMNNNQIVASVSAGVAQAVSSVMGGANGSPIEVTVKVDSETLYRAVRKGERKAYGRYGTTVAIG